MVTLFDVVAAVKDPELRVLNVAELGILRSVTASDDGVTVVITPTYSGCPAMDVIRADIEEALRDVGVTDVTVQTVLTPPWTTDMITEAGLAKLAAARIAPPGPVFVPLSVRCPHCGSPSTEQLSRFGSTACKSLWRCLSCREPFDAVKAI